MFTDFPAISVQTSRNCRTAAIKCSVLPKVLELAYYAAYFQICDFTFQNIYDNNFNYTTFILDTWIHILRVILLNNVTKKYAELSVGDYGMLIQRCNNDVMLNASRPLLRCRPRAQYEVHELPLFVEKSRSCRVVQERALVQHEQVASKKNSLHEHTRALYVIATRRLFYDELNAMSLGWRCDENQLNIFFN